MNDENSALRNARAQAAILRTLVGEMEREDGSLEESGGLRAQAVEESARLVSALEGLSRARSSSPPERGGSPKERLSTGVRTWPRVLVVDDDDETRAAIAKGLGPEYEVVTAADGVEGLKAASEAPFDAIVSDIHMPEMDGITMVARIRQMRLPAVVPVVFLTGVTVPEQVAAGFSAGGTSYLVKPVDLELLDQELRLALSVPRE